MAYENEIYLLPKQFDVGSDELQILHSVWSPTVFIRRQTISGGVKLESSFKVGHRQILQVSRFMVFSRVVTIVV